jgi:hypothetical protein
MNMVFLGARALHVLLGGIWLGAAVLLSFFIVPAIQDAGPDGGKVMMGIAQRGMVTFIASVSGTTVLTGLWLYWHFTDGFDPGIAGSIGGRLFGLGGLLGLAAAIIGGSVVSRNIKKVMALGAQAASATDAAARSQLMQQVGEARQRVATGGRVVAILLMVTIVLMALGHYL